MQEQYTEDLGQAQKEQEEPPRFEQEVNDINVVSDWVTKREWFAAMAMQGLLAEKRARSEETAKMAVRNADALIEELQK